MDIITLQQDLLALGQDLGPTGADGDYGTFTRNAISAALTNIAAPRLAPADIAAAAADLACKPVTIRAIVAVESGGRGFGSTGKPLILYEPHVFSRQSGHRFDGSHPSISSRRRNPKLYPKAQEPRYAQLLEAVGLDVDAAFMAPSYGLFQILGENWKVCDYSSPWAMARAMAKSEGAQLDALVRFVKGNGLEGKLRACSSSAAACVPFVRAYNGPGFAANDYHNKLALAIARG
jgi:N-acetylmuramidase-like protein